MSRHDEARPRVGGEVIGSLVGVGGSFALLVNYWNAYGFLAETTPGPPHVVTYWVLALAMVVGVGWTFESAERRQAPAIAYVWHVLVALVSVAALLALVVPRIEVQESPPPVDNYVNDDPCYSGGDPCG
jgi:hypothetical protein